MTNAFKYRRLIPVAVLAVLGVVLWFVSMRHYIEEPALSHKRGFYKGEILLKMSASNAEKIYYTLDGSTPDASSLCYTEPIRIADATQNPNNYSMLTNVSAGFMTDLLEKYQTIDGIPGYVAPDFPVDKCTVVRAVAVNSSGDVSEVVTASYFVDIDPQKYSSKIISLVTDPENLFDEKNGIYVTGETMSNYIEKYEVYKEWKFWNANYRNRGAGWERPVNLEFFDENGTLQHSQTAGTRVHGGVSRATLPRSLNLYARQDYDNFSNFCIPLFQSDFIPKRITLNSGGNQLITQFSDYMMTDRVRHLNFATMLYQPYVLFINGEYWGFYWLSEKFDENYLEHYYNVDKDNVIVIKNDELEIGAPEDIALFHNMQQFISENDMSVEKNYQSACELIDMESYLDYYATMIYVGRMKDWPGTNFALWRTKETSASGEYADGKWRWMLFDSNSTGMSEAMGLTTFNTLEYVIEEDAVFRSLWASETFRTDFEQRILDIGASCFDSGEMSSFIDRYKEDMEPVLEKSWARFYGRNNDKAVEFDDMMESHRAFFTGRYEAVKNWFQ